MISAQVGQALSICQEKRGGGRGGEGGGGSGDQISPARRCPAALEGNS